MVHLDLGALGVAALCVLAFITLTQLRVWRCPAYFAVGVVMWLAMHTSGVHATIGGVVLGLLVSAYGKRVDVDTVGPEMVHFQYHGLAPTIRCQLVKIHGGEAVRRMPGIVGYRAFARPGDHFSGGVMTLEMDLLSGVCDDHDTLTTVIEEALSVMSYELRFAEGTVLMLATALR